MNAILRKSEAGLQALQIREGEHKLPARLRTLLLQVDGNKSIDQLKALAVSLGNPAELVDRLLEQGLAEVVPGTEEAQPAPEPAAPTATAVAAPVAVPAAAPEPAATPQAAAEAEPEADELPDLPVSAKLPEHLRPVAAEMRRVVEQHVGLKGVLLKRRISHCDTEAELRLALVALTEAVAKARGSEEAKLILQEINTHLPMIGLNRAQTFR
ncbi:hypothetical protein [Chitinimonas koreensis]|uniref:hypothetical protein n=1 Tax=Chitinimonas koreensis TaxID=356302 RepID=UPI0004002FD3|nr:hypothetical protein [Chitinimonas koreensis]QNM94981.1 hypothetical protein H9L41_13765 [Chitinimonas koreensis]